MPDKKLKVTGILNNIVLWCNGLTQDTLNVKIVGSSPARTTKLKNMKYKVDSKIDLSEIKTSEKEDFEINYDFQMDENIKKLSKLQDKLYAQNKYGVLIIIQAMDTAGKDGTIKHVMSGLNPQGTRVHSFKQPSTEEIDHDYLWRASKNLPERGTFGIFNRSYYEDVLVVRIHNLLKSQNIPDSDITEDVWKKRFRQIKDFERYLYENGIITIKFFLHISKDEQKERLIERIDDPTKNWKFSVGDVKERQYWEQYQKCYQEAISETSTEFAPWYVIPADKKKHARLAVSQIIIDTLKELKLEYPIVSPEQIETLKQIKKQLESGEI